MTLCLNGKPLDYSDLDPNAFVSTNEVLARRFQKTRSALTADVKNGRFPKPITEPRQTRYWLARDLQQWFGAKPTAAPKAKAPASKGKSTSAKKGKR